jgi:hypothetical protein
MDTGRLHSIGAVLHAAIILAIRTAAGCFEELARWMKAHGRPEETDLDDTGVVHFERGNRGTPHLGLTDNSSQVPAPAKMTAPDLKPGVKKPHSPAADGILRQHLKPLGVVAEVAIALPLIVTGLDPTRPFR